eukprot:3622233-Rhodomonas_salina.2
MPGLCSSGTSSLNLKSCSAGGAISKILRKNLTPCASRSCATSDQVSCTNCVGPLPLCGDALCFSRFSRSCLSAGSITFWIAPYVMLHDSCATERGG